MRFIFKTDYAQDLRLAKHGGHLFWYGLLGLLLLAAPWWSSEYVMCSCISSASTRLSVSDS